MKNKNHNNQLKQTKLKEKERTPKVPFGLGSKHADAKASKKSDKKSVQADEAAEILKKMEAKKDDGECAFC